MRWRPAASAMRRPVFVEPVKFSRRTSGFSTSSSPISPAAPGACGTTLRTPGGSPASAKISPQSRPPEIGDHSDGLRTTVLPSAIGAVIERNERINAAFHGAIAPTTPTGWRRPIAIVPGMSDGITSPTGAYTVPAAWRRSPGVKMFWNIANPKVAPVSRARRSTISSRRLSSTSAARRRTPCRTAGGADDHSGNAVAAASIARFASARPPAGTFATMSPVNGSWTSNVSPVSDDAQSPPMNNLASRTSTVSVVIPVSLLSTRPPDGGADHFEPRFCPRLTSRRGAEDPSSLSGARPVSVA